MNRSMCVFRSIVLAARVITIINVERLAVVSLISPPWSHHLRSIYFTIHTRSWCGWDVWNTVYSIPVGAVIGEAPTNPRFHEWNSVSQGACGALTHHVNAVEARLVGHYRMDRAGASLQYPTTSQKWVYFGSIKSSCTTLSNRSDTLDRCGIVIECKTPNATTTTTSKPVTTNTVLFHPSVSFSLYI